MNRRGKVREDMKGRGRTQRVTTDPAGTQVNGVRHWAESCTWRSAHALLPVDA